jgi:hypothetical protein
MRERRQINEREKILNPRATKTQTEAFKKKKKKKRNGTESLM